jgi:hypothetical protein
MLSETITDIQRKTGINWPTFITMIVFHIGAVAALFMFTWQALVACLLLWWVTGSLGVGMGYHRLLDASRLQDAESSRVFSDACAGCWPSKPAPIDVGRHAPHPPRAHGRAGRPAHAARR